MDDVDLECTNHEDPFDWHDGEDRLNDLTSWLHEDGATYCIGHAERAGCWYATAPSACIHAFADGSYMNCEDGAVLTFAQATDEIGEMLVNEEVREEYAALSVLARVVAAAEQVAGDRA